MRHKDKPATAHGSPPAKETPRVFSRSLTISPERGFSSAELLHLQQQLHSKDSWLPTPGKREPCNATSTTNGLGRGQKPSTTSAPAQGPRASGVRGSSPQPAATGGSPEPRTVGGASGRGQFN